MGAYFCLFSGDLLMVVVITVSTPPIIIFLRVARSLGNGCLRTGTFISGGHPHFPKIYVSDPFVT